MTRAAPRWPWAATIRRWAGHAIVAAAVLAWIVVLRPQALGGPASYVLVSGHSMRPQLETGDLVITQRKDAYAGGDVIAYRIPPGEPGAGARVIHRITGGSPDHGFHTKGDNRDQPDIWRPRPRDIEGRLWLRLPKAGSLIALLSAPIPLAAAAGLLTFLTIGAGGQRRRASRQATDGTAVVTESARADSRPHRTDHLRHSGHSAPPSAACRASAECTRRSLVSAASARPGRA
jgi:signal peptidase